MVRSLTVLFWVALIYIWSDSSNAGDALRVDPENRKCGNSLVSVFCTIQNAIDAAPSNSTINIAPGKYDFWGDALTIDKSLALYGAGSDKTILDGGGDNPESLINISPSAETVTIRSMTLMNRIRSGSREMGPGAIDHSGGDLMVSDLVMRENQGGWGGAVRIRSEFGEIIFEDVTIEKNTAFTGAAISFYDGPGARLEIRNSKFSNNSAVFSGGALFCRDLGEMELVNVELSGNRTGNTGGAVHVFAQTTSTNIKIMDSKITKNISGSTGGISATGDGIQIILENTELLGNVSEENAEKSDCGSDAEGVFISKGNNRIGVGDGCHFTSTGKDIVGSRKKPITK